MSGGGGALASWADIDVAIDSTWFTICQGCLTAKDAQTCMPLSLSPRERNQNTSAGVTESSLPFSSDDVLPVPFPVFPGHDRQLRSYCILPACAASCCPAYGFFAACAETSALRNFVSTSVASSAAVSRIAAAARACELTNERMHPLWDICLESYIKL